MPSIIIFIGLGLLTLFVLLLPFTSSWVQKNLEAFFLLMGVIAVSVSRSWNWNLALDALRTPLVSDTIWFGIFQIVLIFGLLAHIYRHQICTISTLLYNKLHPRVYIFSLVAVLGYSAAIISLPVAAIILSESLLVMSISRKDKVKLAVFTCFAMGLGSSLTPIGGPQAAILAGRLSGAPYHAGFSFLWLNFWQYIVPGVLGLASVACLYIRPGTMIAGEHIQPPYSETNRSIVIKAVRIYVFIVGLVLLGNGLEPLAKVTFSLAPHWALYWINTTSAILDNSVMTAIEITPSMAIHQIIGATMGLLIGGGILIPGNIPNIVAAERLEISMKEWAVIGVPLGFALLGIYFAVLVFRLGASI